MKDFVFLLSSYFNNNKTRHTIFFDKYGGPTHITTDTGFELWFYDSRINVYAVPFSIAKVYEISYPDIADPKFDMGGWLDKLKERMY